MSSQQRMSNYLNFRNGVLKIDGNLEGEVQAAGQTEYIEVERTFFLGNLKPETLQLNIVKNNLQVCFRLIINILCVGKMMSHTLFDKLNIRKFV